MLDWTNIEEFQKEALNVEQVEELDSTKFSKKELIEAVMKGGLYATFIKLIVSKNIVVLGGGLKLGTYFQDPTQIEPIMDALKLITDGISKL